ncbi:MAG: hypothetical protein IKD23_05655 [Lentisphaeria bacterium]|nr:hypothetical protein [Lentisphaerota bacterium]MBR2625864.1 hypothetical protein [Lentisphaeria bacterium]
MKCSCGCSILIGFLLGVLLGAAAYFYYFLRHNPEAAEKVNDIETQWTKTKETGDRIVNTIKVISPAPPQNQEAVRQ